MADPGAPGRGAQFLNNAKYYSALIALPPHARQAKGGRDEADHSIEMAQPLQGSQKQPYQTRQQSSPRRGSQFLNAAKYYSTLIALPPHLRQGVGGGDEVDQPTQPPGPEDTGYTFEKKQKSPGPEIFPHDRNYHVPYFTFGISILELLVFLYHVIHLQRKHCLVVTSSGPAPLCSALIYDPHRRYEAWRLLSYMFVHSGYIHITSNIIVQLTLGLPLEIVHGPLRICSVYLAGVLTGALATSVTDSDSFLAGASGGVYALLIAHLPTLIMNFRQMKTVVEWLVSILILLVGAVDLSVSIYNRYGSEAAVHGNIGYVAHFGGAAAGFLVGMNVLRNFEHKTWEWWLRLACLVAWIVVLTLAVLYNSLAHDVFPATDLSPIGECDYYQEASCSILEDTHV